MKIKFILKKYFKVNDYINKASEYVTEKSC